MLLDHTHPEDVKSAIRKQYRTVANFIEVHGLPETGVSDLLRGRTSRRVRDAVEQVLQKQAKSINLDNSGAESATHGLNAEAR